MAKGPQIAALIGAGTAASAIGGAYRFAEFINKAKRMRDVGKANAVYVRLIQRVRRDLDEVKRLLSVPEVKDALSHNRPKAEWVYTAMKDTRVALEQIAPLTEKVGKDQEKGSIGVRHRLKWLLGEQEKLENREKELVTVHASLCEVLGFLTALEPVEEKHKHKHKHDTRVVDVEIEKDPRRYAEMDVHYEDHRDPRRVEEREVHIERGPMPRVEERYYEAGPRRYEEREVYIERNPRHVEAQYIERGPDPYNERRVDERSYAASRVLSPDEDREPEYENFIHNAPPSHAGGYRDARDYYEERRIGDPGFGDQEVINPQPLPPMNRGYAREVWVEEKEDYRYDQYGNRLPETLPQRTRYPRSKF
ncbi:hypothetical protein GQ43DRAFT_445134 [Delitschia confertaspora ATCC 74209]|uniref:Uncharacterized protein n=1 Tax=Delitschia confertaspora ATCC 74209 TaxID=1513339 RepID=A0A9P4JDQ1_9PLEO|nr:hypothetical protein GQ43DRAFT_445134 [Delitschia confertaspora ATCC 74209]